MRRCKESANEATERVRVRKDTKDLLRELADYQGIPVSTLVASLAIGARDQLPAKWRSWKEVHRAQA